jgi:hypothetical protein
MLADAIDFPMVFGLGLMVLVPLMAFEVFLEAFVLKLTWKVTFRSLCVFTLVANLLSLVAGIPIKILNAFFYGAFLPEDLPGFFARYPLAVCIGTLFYFAVTVAVEGAYAFRWLRRQGHALQGALVWKGILLANVASYAVVAPLHYFATRPMSQVQEFTTNARWATQATNTICFVHHGTQNLQAVQLDGSDERTIVPIPVTDYLLSADLKICLFRAPSGNLCLWRSSGQSNLVWQTNERFSMNQVAFSPSGNLVAFASEQSNTVEVVELQTGKHLKRPFPFKMRDCSVAWSTEELKFFTRGSETNAFAEIAIHPDGELQTRILTGTNVPPLLPCYGRVGNARWYGGSDWGLVYNADTCGDLNVWTEPGLGSGLRVYRDKKERTPALYLHVNPGLIHLARFYFEDTAFVGGSEECLFEANGYIYLLDIQRKRVGTVARGDRFIMLKSRYQKRL